MSCEECIVLRERAERYEEALRRIAEQGEDHDGDDFMPMLMAEAARVALAENEAQ